VGGKLDAYPVQATIAFADSEARPQLQAARDRFRAGSCLRPSWPSTAVCRARSPGASDCRWRTRRRGSVRGGRRVGRRAGRRGRAARAWGRWGNGARSC